MWWIIGLLLVICAFAFAWFFANGADMKNKNAYAQRLEDDEQERVVATYNRAS